MHAKSTLEIGDMVIESRSAGCLNWVKCGKTLSEYMFSELLQIADILGSPIWCHNPERVEEFLNPPDDGKVAVSAGEICGTVRHQWWRDPVAASLVGVQLSLLGCSAVPSAVALRRLCARALGPLAPTLLASEHRDHFEPRRRAGREEDILSRRRGSPPFPRAGRVTNTSSRIIWSNRWCWRAASRARLRL